MSSMRLAAKLVNRNPRNNELMGRQRKNQGYQFESDRASRSFIYRVELLESNSVQQGFLVHYRDGVILKVSSRDASVAGQLYNKTDACAALNIGRLLGLRCLQAGIHSARPAISPEAIEKSIHQKSFFNALEAEGVSLVEQEALEHSHRNDSSFSWERYPLKATRQEKLDE